MDDVILFFGAVGGIGVLIIVSFFIGAFLLTYLNIFDNRVKFSLKHYVISVVVGFILWFFAGFLISTFG